jgi:hypothetical protein
MPTFFFRSTERIALLLALVPASLFACGCSCVSEPPKEPGSEAGRAATDLAATPPLKEPTSEAGRELVAIVREDIAGHMVRYRLDSTATELDRLILQWESDPKQVETFRPVIALGDLRDAREHFRARRDVVEQSLIFRALEKDEPERLKASDPDYYQQAERSSATVEEWEQQKTAIQQRIAQLEAEAEQSEEFQAAVEAALPLHDQFEREIAIMQQESAEIAEDAIIGARSIDEFFDRFNPAFGASLDLSGKRMSELYQKPVGLAKHRYVWPHLKQAERNQVVQFLPEYLCQSLKLAQDIHQVQVGGPSMQPEAAALKEAIRERRRQAARAAEDAELREMQIRAVEDAMRSLD